MNTFGQSYVEGSQEEKLFPLYDPRAVRADRMRFRRGEVSMLDRANSLHVPTGRYPARGCVLVKRADYDMLSKYSTTLQLEFGDPRKSDNVAALKNLSIVQAQCVTRGLSSDPDALYLVELTDGRGILCNEWFNFPITTQYNIRVPAYPQQFYDSSLNGGTTWTWSTMLQDMWDRMGTFLGAWPGLPSGVTISGTPEGFWFTGVSAWSALCDVLDHLGMTIACDLTSSAPFTIVRPGDADATFSALETKYGGAGANSPNYRLEDDLEWIDTGAGRVPKTVKVLFRRRNSVYGTEETVTYRNDVMAQQWDMRAVYTVSITAPSTFASAVGTHYLWSDFTVRYDDSSDDVDADVATAQQIAQERVTQYFAVIYRQTLGRMSRTYAGALPFTIGSQVDGVRWSMDHQRYGGWRTEIMRGMRVEEM